MTPAHKLEMVGEQIAPRSWLLIGGLGWLAFVALGSLVPFAYEPLPYGEAIDRLRALLTAELSLAHRADWGANILLGVPLGFFWLGVLSWGRRRMMAIAFAVFLVPLLATASLAIEFSQLWFPLRTPSINDVCAQTIGAVVGSTIWITGGQAVFIAWADRVGSRHRPDRLTAVLILYSVVYVLYLLAPLDLTLSPAEIYHKARDGRISLVPFSYNYPSPSTFALAVSRDFFLAIPIGVLSFLLSRSCARSLWLCVAFFFFAEAAQLLVLSRYTDVDDVILGVAGGMTGVWLSLYIAGAAAENQTCHHGVAAEHWLLAAVVYVVALLGMYWQPFDFYFDKVFILKRWANLDLTVAGSLYQSTALNAAYQVFIKLTTFGILGGLVRLCSQAAGRSDRVSLVFNGFGVLACAAVGLTVEAGQLLLPTHTPCASDVALYTMGSFVGIGVVWHLSPASQRDVA